MKNEEQSSCLGSFLEVVLCVILVIVLHEFLHGFHDIFSILLKLLQPQG